MGEVFAVLCLGLVPYTVFQLQLRVFYSMHDSRTPALIGVVTMIVNVGTCYLALALLPPGIVVAGLGVGAGTTAGVNRNIRRWLGCGTAGLVGTRDIRRAASGSAMWNWQLMIC